MQDEEIKQLREEYLLIGEKIEGQYEILKVLKQQQRTLFERLTDILQRDGMSTLPQNNKTENEQTE